METSIAKFNGVEIRICEEMCLTDIWRASGVGKHHAPRQWTRLPKALKLIDEVCNNTGLSRIVRSKRGRRLFFVES